MSPSPRFLCLFSSAAVRGASFFGGREGHWQTDIDAGGCEFVPLVADAEAGALAASGLFAGATALCRADDLDASLAAALLEAARRFRAIGRSFEVVACDGPVALLARLAELAPGLVAHCHQDGEVRPESPSWWRERARRHLAARGGRGEDAPGDAEARPGDAESMASEAAVLDHAEAAADLAAELRAFVARRRRTPGVPS